MSNPKKQCTIASHRHGMKLKDGMPECISQKGGVHVFNGKEVILSGHPLPLIYCSKCNVVSAYYKCNNR